MAAKTYEGNYKVYLLETEPVGWSAAEGSRTITTAELTAGTRLLRLVSNGAFTYTYNQNTASQPLVDEGKISHSLGTREVTGATLTHEIDFPLSSDAMWNLYSYGDVRFIVVAPDGEPTADGTVLHVFEGEMSEAQTQGSAQDTKQNFQVTMAVQDWDLKTTLDAA